MVRFLRISVAIYTRVNHDACLGLTSGARERRAPGECTRRGRRCRGWAGSAAAGGGRETCLTMHGPALLGRCSAARVEATHHDPRVPAQEWGADRQVPRGRTPSRAHRGSRARSGRAESPRAAACMQADLGGEGCAIHDPGLDRQPVPGPERLSSRNPDLIVMGVPSARGAITWHRVMT